MGFVNLRTDPPTVRFSGDLEIEDEFLHGFFDVVPRATYDERFLSALRLGARALLDGRIGVVLARVEEDLDGELQRLRQLLTIGELRGAREKGQLAEESAASILTDLIGARGWDDALVETGGLVGAVPRSKVGDLVATLGDARIVVEVKMEQRYDLGHPADFDARNLAKGAKSTVFGQLLHAMTNREAQFGIFVVDEVGATPAVRDLDPVHLLPQVPGFVVKVNAAEGRWENLRVAYQLARQLVIAPPWQLDAGAVRFLLDRTLRDLRYLREVEADLKKVLTAAKQITTAVESARDRVERTASSLAASEEVLARIISGTAGPDHLAALLDDTFPPADGGDA